MARLLTAEPKEPDEPGFSCTTAEPNESDEPSGSFDSAADVKKSWLLWLGSNCMDESGPVFCSLAISNSTAA